MNLAAQSGSLINHPQAMAAQAGCDFVSQIQIGSFLPKNGGYFGGLVKVNENIKAIIVASKAQGEYRGYWGSVDDLIAGSKSTVDGQQNTLDMIRAGNRMGKWAQALRIAGFADWYVPSLDELEVLYRAFKPGTCENFVFSGKNGSSLPRKGPYSLDDPQQCQLAAFMKGGPESFEEAWYWTSTQDEGSFACVQAFVSGIQGKYWKKTNLRARAIRSVDLSDLVI